MNVKPIGSFLFFLTTVLLVLPLSSDTTVMESKGAVSSDVFGSRYKKLEVLIRQGKDTAAEKYLRETVELCRSHHDNVAVGDIYRTAGIAYSDRENNPPRAFKYLLKAQKIYLEENSIASYAFATNVIGALYWHTDQYDKAMKYYFKALKLYRQTRGHDIDIATILNNIGMVYARLSNYELALAYYRQSLDMRYKQNLKQPISASLNNLGNLYYKMKEYDIALDYFYRSQEIRVKIDDQPGIVRNLNSIGQIYIDTGLLDKGAAYLKKGLELAQAIEYRKGLATSSIKLGSYYYKIKRYDTALPYLNRGIRLAREINSRELLNKACQCIAPVYAAKGNFQQAYRFAAHIKKNIMTAEGRQQLEDMRLAQAMEEKEQKVYRLEKENRIHKLEKRMQIITFGAIFLLLVTGLTYIYKYNRLYKNQLVRKEEKQRRLELETQLKLFQAKINPHFLFNSLNSIKELGKEKDTAALEQTVHRLAHMYRQILYSNETIHVPLEKEIALVTDFLEIEKKMFKGRLDYVVRIPDCLAGFPVLPLTVETLVENAVIHGISPKRKGTVTITAVQNEKGVLVEICDDGIGFEPRDMEPGFGIYSVQERLKLFYNDKARLTIYSRPGEGTRAQMELPHA